MAATNGDVTKHPEKLHGCYKGSEQRTIMYILVAVCILLSLATLYMVWSKLT